MLAKKGTLHVKLPFVILNMRWAKFAGVIRTLPLKPLNRQIDQ